MEDTHKHIFYHQHLNHLILHSTKPTLGLSNSSMLIWPIFSNSHRSGVICDCGGQVFHVIALLLQHFLLEVDGHNQTKHLHEISQLELFYNHRSCYVLQPVHRHLPSYSNQHSNNFPFTSLSLSKALIPPQQFPTSSI